MKQMNNDLTRYACLKSLDRPSTMKLVFRHCMRYRQLVDEIIVNVCMSNVHDEGAALPRSPAITNVLPTLVGE